MSLFIKFVLALISNVYYVQNIFICLSLDQWFLTFLARRTPKIIIGLHGPLKHLTDRKKMLFRVHYFTIDIIIDPKTHSTDPWLRSYRV
jgi:hypothetical protein